MLNIFNLAIGKLLAKLIAKQEGPFKVKQANIYKVKLIFPINIKVNNVFYVNKIRFYKLPQLAKQENLNRKTKANKGKIITKTNNIDNRPEYK